MPQKIPDTTNRLMLPVATEGLGTTNPAQLPQRSPSSITPTSSQGNAAGDGQSSSAKTSHDNSSESSDSPAKSKSPDEGSEKGTLSNASLEGGSGAEIALVDTPKEVTPSTTPKPKDSTEFKAPRSHSAPARL